MKKSIFLSILTIIIFAGGYTAWAAILAPANIAVKPISPTQVDVSWSTSTDGVSYEIYRNGTSTPVATTSQSNYSDQGLSPDTTYTYYLTAIDASSTKSDLSAGVATTTLSDTTKPSVPTNLTATLSPNTQANLDWDNSTDNVAVVGYKIYRNNVLIATTISSLFANTGLVASATYYYQVSAYDAAGNESDKSATTTVTTVTDTTSPTIPTGLGATPVSTSQINLIWNASSDEFGVSGYKIYRNNAYHATVSGTTFNDTGLAAATAYNYQVTAFDPSGNESGKTATATATTYATNPDNSAPTIPTGLGATPVSTSQINLSWNASSDDFGVTGYKIYRDNSYRATVSGLSYNDTGLSASTAYNYQVTAFDLAGNESAKSATSTATTFTRTQTNVVIKFYNGPESNNQINLNSSQIVKIAVYSDDYCDACSLLNNSVKFGGATAISWISMDLNSDGKIDKIYSFRAKDMKDLVAGDAIIAKFYAQDANNKSFYAELTVKVINAPTSCPGDSSQNQNKINKFEQKIEDTKEKLMKKIEKFKEKAENKIAKFEEKIEKSRAKSSSDCTGKKSGHGDNNNCRNNDHNDHDNEDND